MTFHVKIFEITLVLFPINFIFWGLFNMMEVPSTTVPLGLDQQGLPMGVQIISGRGNDHVTIRIAQELEKKFGGWKVPPTNKN